MQIVKVLLDSTSHSYTYDMSGCPELEILCCAVPLCLGSHLQNVQRASFGFNKDLDRERAVYEIEMRDGDHCGEVLARVTSPVTDSGGP